MQNFLGFLFPKTSPGVITLWLDKSRLSRHIPLAELARLSRQDIEEIEQRNSIENVYIGAGLRREGLGTHQQGVKGDVIAVTALPLDIDLWHPGAHKSKNLPKTPQEAAAILACAPDPSILVNSGHGWQAWWMLKAPILMATMAQRNAFEYALKAFQQRFRTRAQELGGWDVDETHTIQRVWRLPGFNNVKIPDSPVPVEVLEYTSDTYSLVDLLGDDAPSMDNLPPSIQVQVAAAPPDDDLKKIRGALKGLSESRNKQMIEQILKGRSFAELGERDAAIQRAASTIVWAVGASYNFAPDVVAEIFRPSLKIWADELGADKTLDEEMAKVIEKVKRAQKEFQAAQEKEAAQLAAIENALKRSIEAAQPPPVQSPGAVMRRREKHSIIMYGNNHYVFNYGLQETDPQPEGYSRVLFEKELLTYCQSAWEGSPLSTTYERDDQVKDKTLLRIKSEYATVANDVYGDLTLAKSYFDPSTGIFHEAVAPLRGLEPRFDANIDAWLQIATDNPDKLLDWLACVTLLQDACCALYFVGESGAGKSLIADGIARLWTEGNPAQLKNVVGNFNEDATRCPFIQCDEGLDGGRGADVSKVLRSLISSHSFTRTKKQATNTSVHGAVRILIGANNTDLLKNIARMSLNKHDIKAISKRFLLLNTTSKSKEWFEMNNVAKVLSDQWVKGDLFARHLLWLRDNRVVVRGDRFIVDGCPGGVERVMARGSEREQFVAQWIAGFLAEPRVIYGLYKSQKRISLAGVGNGQLRINAKAILEFWDAYIGPEYKKATPFVIAQALKRISTGQQRGSGGNRARYFDIDPVYIFDWADESGLHDEDTLRENLDRVVAHDEFFTTAPDKAKD